MFYSKMAHLEELITENRQFWFKMCPFAKIFDLKSENRPFLTENVVLELENVDSCCEKGDFWQEFIIFVCKILMLMEFLDSKKRFCSQRLHFRLKISIFVDEITILSKALVSILVNRISNRITRFLMMDFVHENACISTSLQSS